ncbi:hypothetical protein [Variovorax sp. J31P207]|uniref:hypothetical protein n=1 Tax=Variovorax sp. J31P207 TaxID=3053510 RepID=UPI002574DE72|nr:hypothetical protein [Variovorax sp. J31P207]MDM0068780.1 hypothetical protein [Variovorax sp. J31P207]
MRTVYATALEVGESSDVSIALDYVGRWIHDWYRRQRLSVEVRGNLASGDLVLEPAEGHRLSIHHHSSTGEPQVGLVDIRWEYPDQYDASLGWVVSIALLNTPSGLILSLDLAVTGLQLLFAPANFKLGSPRVIRDISRLRSVRIANHPYNVSPEVIGAEEIEALVSELTDQARPFPIVVVSRRPSDDHPPIDTSGLAERLAGVAKVYELSDKWAAFRLTEVLSKPLSCFAGAVRLYWPHFSSEADPYLHPLWMPWQFRDVQVADRTLADLVGMVFDAAAFRYVEPAATSRFRQSAAREQREASRANSPSSADELLEDLVAVETQLEELQRAHADLLRENETLRGNAIALAAHAGRSGTVSQARAGLDSEGDAEESESPRTVEDAVKWASQRTTHIAFLDSAYSTASQSPFRHPDRAVQALMAIDEVAAIWANSIETGKSVGSIRQLFKKRGFEYADDVSQTSKGKWGGEYVASYKGRDIDISPHITIGAKQADSCLSVHWAWDREEKSAIVAHVGRHKTNTKT